MSKRSSNVIKNTVWEMGYYLIVIALGFLAPRFIILAYGSEVNGLTSTITQIMNVILLLQSGASTAAVFTLFKPIAEKDTELLSKRVAVAERFYRKIAIIFLAIMIVASIVTAFTLESGLAWQHILIAFVIMGFKSFLDLFYTSKFRVVFTAFQQKFVLSIATLIEQILYYALVFITIALKWHFLWLYLWFFAGCVAKVVYLEWVFKRDYSERVPKFQGKTTETIPSRNHTLANEMSHSAVGSSTTIIMSYMHGLEATSVCSVYGLVSSALSLISTSLHSAFAPSFADLCVKAQKQEARRVFGIFQFVFIMFNAFLLMCMMFLIQPFVKIYTQGATDVNYQNAALAFMMAISGMCSAYRVPYNVMVSSLGYFKETWLQPVITAAVSLLLSFGFGHFGSEYISVGPAVFYLVNFLYQHFKLKKLVPHLVSNRVFVTVGITALGLLIAMFVTANVAVPNGILAWIVAGVVTAVCSVVYLGGAALIFDRKNLFMAFNYMKSLLLRRKG